MTRALGHDSQKKKGKNVREMSPITEVLNSLLLHVFWRETKDEVQLR